MATSEGQSAPPTAVPASPVDGLVGPEPGSSSSLVEPRRRFELRGRSLREHAARGVLINTVFMIGLSFLGLVKGFLLAGFLSPTDYGVFGVAAVSINTLVSLREIGIRDKFIQQDEVDQEVAFQKAFTLQLMIMAISTVVLVGAMPVIAAVYGESELILPGLVLIFAVAAGSFQTPLWIFTRRMEFLTQRVLSAVDPVVAFVVSILLAIAGAGYWALVVGIAAGAWSAAIASMIKSPYRLRLRYDREALRTYWQFSWPLFMTALGTLLLAQASVLSTEARLGMAGAGALILAVTITQFTERVDALVTGTLYPAICTVKDRTDLLLESFVKSNRLALMWAMPFGMGVSLFCGDLVALGIGEKWRPAIPLLQVFGVIAALGHIGFNWDAYFRARGQTKPMAIASIASAVTFLAGGIPLLYLAGLRGLAVGVGLAVLVHVGLRAYFLSRMFHGLAFLRHALRAILPSVPAIAIVVAMRLIASAERTPELVGAEIVLYLAVTAAGTWWLEAPLLREAVGYLRRRRAAGAAA